MTYQQLVDLLSGDIVQIAVPGAIHLVTLHPKLCALANQPSTFLGHVSAWSTNSGQWISIDPAAVVAHQPLQIDLTAAVPLT
jgi:hypothetical protein